MTRRDSRTRKRIPVRVTLFQPSLVNVEYENQIVRVRYADGASLTVGEDLRAGQEQEVGVEN